MQLSSHQAQVAMDGAESKALALGVPVVIAILDAGAHLKGFRRMDGAVLGSIDIAMRKASTAVLFQANSEAVWEYCKPGAAAPTLELTNGGLAAFGGGDASGTARDGAPYSNTYKWYLQLRDARIVRAPAFFDSIAFDEFWSRVSTEPSAATR